MELMRVSQSNKSTAKQHLFIQKVSVQMHKSATLRPKTIEIVQIISTAYILLTVCDSCNKYLIIFQIFTLIHPCTTHHNNGSSTQIDGFSPNFTYFFKDFQGSERQISISNLLGPTRNLHKCDYKKCHFQAFSGPCSNLHTNGVHNEGH